jgi:hypothetical protein
MRHDDGFLGSPCGEEGWNAERGRRKGHMMDTLGQRNQQFEIYNQRIETLKELTGKQLSGPGRFFCNIKEL